MNLKKIRNLLIITALVAIAVAFLYPTGNRILQKVRARSYAYGQSLPGNPMSTSILSLPFEESFNSNSSGWSKWGSVQFTDRGVSITGERVSANNGIFLKNSQSWTDYAFNVNLDWNLRDNITLNARYRDANNRESCTFSKSGVRIFERHGVGGEQKQLFQGSDLIVDTTVNLGIRVIKDKIECLVDGNVAAYVYGADSSLIAGGIGISTWSQSVGNTSILLHDMNVSTFNSPQQYAQLYNVMATTMPMLDQLDQSGVNPDVQRIIFPDTSSATLHLASNDTSAQSVPVLLYHGVVAQPDGSDITVTNFDAQMGALKKDGWRTISIYDYDDFIQGKKTLPLKSFLLTFDDGRKDSWVGADPILKELGYQATMFAIVDRIDVNRNFQLSLADLPTMNASGRWQIQSHGDRDHDYYILDTKNTSGHFLSDKFWLAAENRFETPQEFQKRVSSDLTLAKTTLQGDFGKPIIAFAYPFSNYGQDTVNFLDAENIVLPAVQSIYALAFYQVNPTHIHPFNYPNPGQFMQKRILVDANWTGTHLVDLLDANEVKNLPYSAEAFDTNSWILDWGQNSIVNNSMDLESMAPTNGSLTYLSGSELWSNYNVQANVSWIKGGLFAIIGRIKDDQNFVECVFGDHHAKIVERENGVNTALQEGISPNGVGGGIYNLGMRVYENKVACTVDSNDVVTALATQAEPLRGDIGFKTEDSIPGDSAVLINNLHVTPLATDIAMLAFPSVAASEPSSTPMSVAPTSSPMPNLQIPYIENNFVGDKAWNATWGTMTIDSSGLMDLGADASTTGANVILKNSGNWTDYKFEATLDWTKGRTFGLVARYADENNYVRCEFYQENPGSITMQLEQYINGRQIVLAASGEFPAYNQFGRSSIDTYIEVNGTRGTCSFNNHTIDNSGDGYTINWPFSGGIGFTTWDPTMNNSQIVVKNVNIEDNY